ncbi:MAG: hypothetical protein JNL83_02405 [Myxococcales bacterium]|nr:hypothetical protein [Myxococcales bacterium]
MSARTIRTAFAAPFVLTVACGKTDPKPAPAPSGPTAVLLLEIASEKHGGTCSVVEACPMDVPCDPARPYLIECDLRFRDEDDAREYLGVMSNGTCRTRPATCTQASCFGKDTPCPHQELPPLRVAYWAVERDGTTCAITPRGLRGAPDGPTKTVPCPDLYGDPIVAIVRDDLKRCRVLESIPRPQPPGSTSNPPEPRYPPCPAE